MTSWPSLRGVLVAVVAARSSRACCCSRGRSTLADVRDDPAAFGFAFRSPTWSLTEVLALPHRTAGAGYAAWGLYAAAASPLVVASGPRLAWVGARVVARRRRVRGGVRAVAARPDASVPAPEGALVAAALGLAIAAGLGIGAFGDELRRARFGWRQLAAVARERPASRWRPWASSADSFDGRWRLGVDRVG